MVKHYLLETWGHSSSHLHGPYASEAARDQAGLVNLSLPESDSGWVKIDDDEGRWFVHGFDVKGAGSDQ